MLSTLVPFAAALLVAAAPPALPAGCESLDEGELARAHKLLGTLRGYGCCTEPLARCLENKDACALAPRLASDVCRLVRRSEDDAAVEKLFAKRVQSMSGQGSAQFALDPGAMIGDPKAPVTSVLYVCSRCPFCKDVVLGLQREVTEGALRGKVKLYLRPFPLKGHDGAAEGDLAMMSAARMGKLWPYASFQFKQFDHFHPAVLSDWAEFAGLDREAFDATFADPKTREALAESKKEGLRNKVEGTPTLFINGRRYQYDLSPEVLVDVLTEEYDAQRTR